MKHVRPMTFVRFVLLAVCLWALRRQFTGLEPAVLLERMRGYSWSQLGVGIAGVALSFLLLGMLELVTLWSQEGWRGRIPILATLATAFVAHAFSQAIGLALLTGTAVRMRAYRRYGFGTTAAAHVSAAAMLSVSLGLLAAGSWALLATTTPVTVGGHRLPERPLGILLGGVVLAYVVWSFRVRTGVATPRWWHLPRPTPTVAVAQIGLATADWLVTGVVLYVFLPTELAVSVWPFLSVYSIAQMMGMLSHVPGGAGVFEVVLVGLLTAATPAMNRAALLAALIMFRTLYYLLPLCVAILVAAVAELRRSRELEGDRDLPSATTGASNASDPA